MLSTTLCAPTPEVRRECYLSDMQPTAVALNEQLPEAIYACTLFCRACRSDLLYQRQERPRFPRHFFFCPRCGRRYAAGQPWSPDDHSPPSTTPSDS